MSEILKEYMNLLLKLYKNALELTYSILNELRDQRKEEHEHISSVLDELKDLNQLF